MVQLIDLDSAREIFTRWFSPWLEFFDELEARSGQLQFQSELGPYLKSSGHDSYPLHYERWPKLMQACRSAIERSSSADLVVPGTDISFATPQDRGRFLIELISEFDQLEPLVGP
jgi:hypothetical protein